MRLGNNIQVFPCQSILGATKPCRWLHSQGKNNIKRKLSAAPAVLRTLCRPQHYKMIVNVVEPEQARYIALREDLQAFLQGKFGSDIDFKIEV